MLKRFQFFLGPERTQALILLFALTGLGNLILNAFVQDVTWARDAQTALVFVFIIGAAGLIISRMEQGERGRWIGILAPAIGALILGVFFIPKWLPVLAGLAVGWVFSGSMIFKARGPMEYREAIRHFRKNEYKEAVEVMDTLIKLEPDDANHYRFRAEILRIWGKLDRARRDYSKMAKLEPELPTAWNGLAEIELQAGNYTKAREYGLKAFELAPQEWVAAYNLGMIEDRLRLSDEVIQHLTGALEIKVPDARHRLLIYLYMARAYARLDDADNADKAIQMLKKQQGGLNEWQIVLQSDQADTLREVLAKDIALATDLANNNADRDTLKD